MWRLKRGSKEVDWALQGYWWRAAIAEVWQEAILERGSRTPS
jgi:hypothetical protein